MAERGLTKPGDETLFDRLAALRDVVPPSTRQAIAQRISTVSSYGSTAFVWGGRAAWVLTTTALLFGLPYALAVEDEMRVVQQERDMASQQQGAQQVGPAARGGEGRGRGAGRGGPRQRVATVQRDTQRKNSLY